jgi:hypothetical protein
LKRFTENFPGCLRNFGQFGRSGRYNFFFKFIAAQFFSLALRENFDTPEIILGILGIFILPDNFGHVRKVEENFHLCPNIFGTLEKIN